MLEEQEQAEVFTQVKRQRIENNFKERRRSAFDDRKLQKQLTESINIAQQLDEVKNIPLENNSVLKEYETNKIDQDGEEMKIGHWVRTLTIDDVSTSTHRQAPIYLNGISVQWTIIIDHMLYRSIMEVIRLTCYLERRKVGHGT
ncbi:hypothetical protein HW132_35100 [Brasilonema sp. CT11]|nr:hypothetical protein [Brasilonema sp. CT11]